MKSSFPVLPISLVAALALAGCRGRDPDQAPPVGLAPVSTAAAAEPLPTPAPEAAPASLDRRERSRRFRAATQAAREQLDTAWNRCGTLAGDTFARCRDQAVIDYDQAMQQSRRTWGNDVDERGALGHGTVEADAAFKVAQVPGTRG